MCKLLVIVGAVVCWPLEGVSHFVLKYFFHYALWLQLKGHGVGEVVTLRNRNWPMTLSCSCQTEFPLQKQSTCIIFFHRPDLVTLQFTVVSDWVGGPSVDVNSLKLTQNERKIKWSERKRWARHSPSECSRQSLLSPLLPGRPPPAVCSSPPPHRDRVRGIKQLLSVYKKNKEVNCEGWRTRGETKESGAEKDKRRKRIWLKITLFGTLFFFFWRDTNGLLK